MPRRNNQRNNLNGAVRLLPQRRPFLFIDRVLEFNKLKKIIAVKHIRKNYSFFKGHFPGDPVFPGALALEAMGQACILLFILSKPEFSAKLHNFYLIRVTADFVSLMRPGEKLVLESYMQNNADDFGIFSVKAFIEDRLVARAKIILAVKSKLCVKVKG
jgi:3-hydroxyacyl-[acyl-carrier-protein] dehydratase